MKKLILLLVLLVSHLSFSQTDIDRILEIGIVNAQRYSQDYFAAGGESLVNNMSNGWYNTAKVKKLFHFEIGVVGNLSFVREEKQTFLLNTRDYVDLVFTDPNLGTAENVPNALGQNQNGISVTINPGQISEFQVTLPNGIGGSALNSIPGGFIQGSMGLIKSTEIKLRFLPKLKVRDNAKIQLYGAALQHEITDWIFSLKRFPLRISGLLGYTNVKGFYDLNAESGIGGSGQEVKLNSNSWVISGILSTKLPVINFYGGIGYYFGSTDADVLGTYQIQNGPFASDIITNPISVRNKTNGVKATIGAKVQYGVFRANLDYSLQNYQNLTLGMKVGF
ncbi:DUF6588 family protein [Aquimarina sp. MMG016]|uniref:DUF6588 family protein n=1 Tax=Aquimarina sp. MMG016 TaxID=2822690 RepID=UPI001B3A28A3|nr:DUF6588 family protein [Aquimarina sp. MMG016]MBQ4822218.1 hypothetical protein [Aquimarina sp. MMG016]